MRKTLTVISAVAALAAAIAGCGGSSSSKAAGVILAPQAGATADSTTAVASASSSSSTATAPTTATVPTPKSGPLSKEPAVIVPKGPAPTSVQTKDLITGTGATAKSGSTITVNYVGYLYKTGKVFDASWKRDQTFTTPLTTSSVIPGWVTGIAGMKVGGRRELIIPAVDGYGKAGSGSTIPPNAPLVFIVDLLKVS